jgi:hypothetical protein
VPQKTGKKEEGKERGEGGEEGRSKESDRLS